MCKLFFVFVGSKVGWELLFLFVKNLIYLQIFWNSQNKVNILPHMVPISQLNLKTSLETFDKIHVLYNKYLNDAFEKGKFNQRQVQIPNTVFMMPADFRK